MSNENPVSADGDATPQTKRSLGARAVSWTIEIAIIVVGALIISALLRGFIAQVFIIPTGSMENTLVPQDRVLVSKIGGFQRGDVVVFEDPGGWMTITKTERSPVGQVLEFVGLLPATGTNHLIKRVIGMPGDRVSCCDAQGRLSVNGQPLDETSYLFTDANGVMAAPANVPFDIVVPRDRIFVMGDHRNASGDSRCHLNDLSQEGKGMGAFIPVSKVVGASVAIVSPLNRLGTFSVPDTFKSVPAPTQAAPEQPVLTVVNPGC